MFINGPGDQGSSSGWVISKTQKIVLDATLLNTQHYRVWIKGKWSTPGPGIAPSLTPQCCSYWRGSLWVTFKYGWSTYLYMYKQDLTWNNLQGLICPESLPTINQQINWPTILKLYKYADKVLLLDRNSYFIPYISVLDRNAWYHITVQTSNDYC